MCGGFEGQEAFEKPMGKVLRSSKKVSCLDYVRGTKREDGSQLESLCSFSSFSLSSHSLEADQSNTKEDKKEGRTRLKRRLKSMKVNQGEKRKKE